MQKYTKIYLEKFKLTTGDFIPCECCGKKATEIHHLLGRKGNLLNKLENSMAVCRTCHDDYGQIKHFMYYMLKIHKRQLQLHNIDFDNDWFLKWMDHYRPFAAELEEE